MDYDPFLGLNDVDYLFKTSRGSAYAKHTDNTTTRNRSGAGHRDTSVGMQQRSGKTIFMPSDGVDNLGRMFQNPNTATQIIPLAYDQKTKTGTVAVKALEDGTNMWTGPFKKGQVLAQSTFTTVPQVGFAPVEINQSESPKGDKGKGVHFGTQITEVKPRSAFKATAPIDNDVIDAVFPSDKRRTAGKAGIAAALAGGAGAASAGDLRRAVGDVAESFLPLGITPSTLAPGTLTPEQRAASDAATQRKRQQEEAAKMKAQALLRSGVPMPEEYRQGGRVRMI
jgi:hypothetical protein